MPGKITLRHSHPLLRGRSVSSHLGDFPVDANGELAAPVDIAHELVRTWPLDFSYVNDGDKLAAAKTVKPPIPSPAAVVPESKNVHTAAEEGDDDDADTDDAAHDIEALRANLDAAARPKEEVVGKRGRIKKKGSGA